MNRTAWWALTLFLLIFGGGACAARAVRDEPSSQFFGCRRTRPRTGGAAAISGSRGSIRRWIQLLLRPDVKLDTIVTYSKPRLRGVAMARWQIVGFRSAQRQDLCRLHGWKLQRRYGKCRRPDRSQYSCPARSEWGDHRPGWRRADCPPGFARHRPSGPERRDVQLYFRFRRQEVQQSERHGLQPRRNLVVYRPAFQPCRDSARKTSTVLRRR